MNGSDWVALVVALIGVGGASATAIISVLGQRDLQRSLVSERRYADEYAQLRDSYYHLCTYVGRWTEDEAAKASGKPSTWQGPSPHIYGPFLLKLYGASKEVWGSWENLAGLYRPGVALNEAELRDKSAAAGAELFSACERQLQALQRMREPNRR